MVSKQYSELSSHIFNPEDVNSASYALMLKDGNDALIALLESLLSDINLAAATADIAMLARTHGQPASPTSLGKELNVLPQELKKNSDTKTKKCTPNGVVLQQTTTSPLAYPE